MARSKTKSPDSVAASLGPRVRAARQDAGLSQGELAQSLGTTQSTVSLYESGARNLSIDTLLEVARVLNRPLHYFVGEPGHMLYVRSSRISSLLGELEDYREEIPQLRQYWEFLQQARANGWR